MSKILITLVESSGIEPFEVEGKMTCEIVGKERQRIYYIGGSSYPAETVLEDDTKKSISLHPIFDDICKSFFGGGKSENNTEH